MPALSHRAIAQAFQLAFAESGASALELSPRPGFSTHFYAHLCLGCHAFQRSLSSL